MSTESPIVYLILGAAGSGRREVVADLIEAGISSDEKTVVFLADSEAASSVDERLSDVTRWTASDPCGVARGRDGGVLCHGWAERPGGPT